MKPRRRGNGIERLLEEIRLAVLVDDELCAAIDVLIVQLKAQQRALQAKIRRNTQK